MSTVCRYTAEEVSKASFALARKLRTISEECYRDGAETDVDADAIRINLVEESARVVGLFEVGGDRVFEVVRIALPSLYCASLGTSYSLYVESEIYSGFVPRDFSGDFNDLL